MRVFGALLLLLAGLVPARAELLVSPRADKVLVVVYSAGADGSVPLEERERGDGLALISETRTIELPAGVSDIQFRNVAATLVPQTVQVVGLDGISERNFDFNLLTPGALLAKSVGQTVRLRRIDPGTGAAHEVPALVRSGPDGVMLETADGAQAQGCSGLKEDIVFDRLPENLLDVPSLSLRASVPRPGRYTISLSYLATGLTWSADYVARIAQNSRLNLSGWITLANVSETGFAGAPVQVVAGKLETRGNNQPVEPALRGRSSLCWPMGAVWSRFLPNYERIVAAAPRMELQGFEVPFSGGDGIETVASSAARVSVRDLGDLKLYDIAEPTTLAAKQMKQIRFLDSRNVPFRRIYRVDAVPEIRGVEEEPRPARLILRLTNDMASRLGKPLPAGKAAISEVIAGTPVLLGRPDIRDTPINLPMELKGDEISSVSAQLRALPAAPALAPPDGGTRRRSYELIIGNSKAVSITFEWALSDYYGNERQKLVTESHPHTRDGRGMVWTLQLKPNSQMILRYTIDWPR